MSNSELDYMARALARIAAKDPLLYQRIVGPVMRGAQTEIEHKAGCRRQTG